MSDRSESQSSSGGETRPQIHCRPHGMRVRLAAAACAAVWLSAAPAPAAGRKLLEIAPSTMKMYVRPGKVAQLRVTIRNRWNRPAKRVALYARSGNMGVARLGTSRGDTNEQRTTHGLGTIAAGKSQTTIVYVRGLVRGWTLVTLTSYFDHGGADGPVRVAVNVGARSDPPTPPAPRTKEMELTSSVTRLRLKPGVLHRLNLKMHNRTSRLLSDVVLEARSSNPRVMKVARSSREKPAESVRTTYGGIGRRWSNLLTFYLQGSRNGSATLTVTVRARGVRGDSLKIPVTVAGASAPAGKPILTIEPSPSQVTVTDGGERRLDVTVRNRGSAPARNVVLSLQSRNAAIVKLAKGANQIAGPSFMRTFPSIDPGGSGRATVYLTGEGAGRSAVLILAGVEGGVSAKRVDVPVTVATAPRRVPSAGRNVRSLFRGTMDFVEVRETRGGRFRVLSLGPAGKYHVPMPEKVVVVRPNGPLWPATVEQWRDLREKERQAASKGSSAAKSVAGSAVAGWLGQAADMAYTVASGMKAMYDVVHADSPQQTREAVEGIAIPATAQAGYHGMSWADVRRKRIALERTLEENVFEKMMAGTIEQKGRKPTRGFARKMSDGQWYFIELGED